MSDEIFTTGRFVWNDLMTKDADHCRAFYTELFNWKTNEMDMGDMGKYTMLLNGPDQHGQAGIVPLEDDDVPSHWISYVTVDDVDATLAKVEGWGGTVAVPGVDIPGVGRFGVIQDPQGAVISPFRSASGEPPIREKKDPGDFRWYELVTEDLPGAKTFYANVFGWTFEESSVGPDGYWIAKRKGDMPVCALMKKPPQMPVAAAWTSYINVEKINETHARALNLGGNEYVEVTKIPNAGYFSMLSDPSGAVFALYENA